MNQKEKIYQYFKGISKSIWLFPIILTLALILLTCLKINGSSMGIYYSYFFGNTNDPSLIFNHPRAIRSDEWVVNTQMAIAQSHANFVEVNKNLGDGADMSLIVDAPYAGFTQLFKPHNLSFFILPFDYAFAFKWWVMGYLLILSAYFFTLVLLPDKKKLAAIISLTLFFTPFIQWWYQYITLAPIFYTLFAGTIFILLTKAKTIKKRLLYSVLLTYVIACFALVQYPAFQIPCAWIIALFMLGYLIELRTNGVRYIFKNIIAYVLVATIVAASVVGLFLYEKKSEVNVIAHTVYPGARLIHSGHYSITHLLSNNLSYQFQNDTKASSYSIQSAGAINQSESSNFILLIPFLVIPSVYLIWTTYKRKKFIDYPLLMTLFGFIACLVWLFIPGLDLIGKITLLDKVPPARLLIGIGLLNLICIILFIRRHSTEMPIKLSRNIIYSISVWIILIVVGWRIHLAFPLFIGLKGVLALSLPIPLSIHFLLKGRYIIATLIICLFSFISTSSINPIYHGTNILTQNNLSKSIESFNSNDSKKWVVEDSLLQSFAFLNGKPSLTGIYEYPQLEVWMAAHANPDIYNRYAHVNFVFDRDAENNIPTKLVGNGSDHFGVFTEPCSNFMKTSNVGYIITSGNFNSQNAPCAQLAKQVVFPTATYSIYRLSF